MVEVIVVVGWVSREVVVYCIYVVNQIASSNLLYLINYIIICVFAGRE